jgi:hypothetical protein
LLTHEKHFYVVSPKVVLNNPTLTLHQTYGK